MGSYLSTSWVSSLLVDGWIAAGGMGVKTKPGKLGVCLAKKYYYGQAGSVISTIRLSQASLAKRVQTQMNHYIEHFK